MKHNLKTLFEFKKEKQEFLFDKYKAENWFEDVFKWLFLAGEENCSYQSFEKKEHVLKIQLHEFLEQLKMKNAESIAEDFFSKLYTIHEILLLDLEAAIQFDPAAKSESEVILAYPGFYTIVNHRIAHYFWNQNIPVFPRVLSEYSRSKTGVDIHPAAKIGKHFFIDHCTGVVIGETAIIGNNVKMYQGVTLGALSVSKDKADQKRHPTIEDNVTIYANATILGGETVIGKNSIIGGNVWLTETIPSNTMVFHKSEIIVKDKIDISKVINFSI